MENLQEIKTQLEHALSQIQAYEEKATKACSARIRSSLGSIKKAVTAVRAELVQADRAS